MVRFGTARLYSRRFAAVRVRDQRRRASPALTVCSAARWRAWCTEGELAGVVRLAHANLPREEVTVEGGRLGLTALGEEHAESAAVAVEDEVLADELVDDEILVGDLRSRQPRAVLKRVRYLRAEVRAHAPKAPRFSVSRSTSFSSSTVAPPPRRTWRSSRRRLDDVKARERSRARVVERTRRRARVDDPRGARNGRSRGVRRGRATPARACVRAWSRAASLVARASAPFQTAQEKKYMARSARQGFSHHPRKTLPKKTSRETRGTTRADVPCTERTTYSPRGSRTGPPRRIDHQPRGKVLRRARHLARRWPRAPPPSRGHILTRPLARDTRPARALKHPRGGADPTTRRW